MGCTPALASFPTTPYVLQRFHKGKRVRVPYLDRASGEIREMDGRVRLCPLLFRRRGYHSSGRHSRDRGAGRQTDHPRDERRGDGSLPHRGRRRLSIGEAQARRWVRARQRWFNFLAAGIVAVAVYFAVPQWLHGATRVVAAYDAAARRCCTCSGCAASTVIPGWTRARAAVDDPGRNLILLIVLASVVLGLIAAIAILGRGPQVQTSGERWAAYVLGILAISVGWFLVHTVYTFRYAHLFWYDDDGDGVHFGGIRFPGTDEPSDYDFAYFAFTLGTSFRRLRSASHRHPGAARGDRAFDHLLRLQFGDHRHG